MARKFRTFVQVATVVLMALPAAATASHMTSYTDLPTEHDDQGSSSEPDQLCTAVLIPWTVCNRVVDTNNDYVAEQDANFAGAVLAPGCTNVGGARLPNGECGLWTIGARDPNTRTMLVSSHRVGNPQGNGPGMTGPGAAYVRFLDVHPVAESYTNQKISLDVNKKLQEVGAEALLGTTVLAGPTAFFAWYGTWSDKNGNGIIDQLTDASGLPTAENEFEWAGGCWAWDHAESDSYCHQDPASVGRPNLAAWIFPGNHHATCGGVVARMRQTCYLIPADIPGQQALLVAEGAAAPAAHPATAPFCAVTGDYWYGNAIYGYCTPDGTYCTTPAPSYGQCLNDPKDVEYEDQYYAGDPLLGAQNWEQPLWMGGYPDLQFYDRTGERDPTVRGFAAGGAVPAWFYDQSLLVSTVMVAGLGCDWTNVWTGLDAQSCRFLDVDKYASLNPTTEQLLQREVKPVLRTNWLVAREEFAPASNTLGSLTGGKILYETQQRGVQGQFDDAVIDPGWAREPNTGGDLYAGASHGDCTRSEDTFRGYCNAYAGGWRAWTDLHMVHTDVALTPLAVEPGVACALCDNSGATFNLLPSLNMPIAGSTILRDPGDHRRTLQPGGYTFAGNLGQWDDQPREYAESFDDPNCPTEPANDLGSCGGPTGMTRSRMYYLPPDGWVGSVVDATQTFHYRGYQDGPCPAVGEGSFSYATCNPYLDGNIADPQQAGDVRQTEWKGGCSNQVGGVANLVITLTPSAPWPPVFVFQNYQREHDLNALGDGRENDPLAAIRDYSGSTTPIRIIAQCVEPGGWPTGAYVGNDMVYFPMGNINVDVTTTLRATVGMWQCWGFAWGDGCYVEEAVTDQDIYTAWSP